MPANCAGGYVIGRLFKLSHKECGMPQFHPFTGHKQLRIGRFSETGRVYLITTSTFDRERIFSEWRYARAAIQAFLQPSLLKTSRVMTWVLMPDHVHWLLQPGDDAELSRLVGAMKSSSARAVRQAGCKRRVWAPASHDHAVRSEDDILPLARYVVANPLRAGLVRRVGEYPFWDAIWM